MSKHHERITALAINHFGDGGHPEASPATLRFFEDDYKHKCLSIAAMCDDLTEAARVLAAEAAKVIREAR